MNNLSRGTKWHSEPITTKQMKYIRWLIYEVQPTSGHVYSFDELSNMVKTKKNAGTLIDKLREMEDNLPENPDRETLQANQESIEALIESFAKTD